MKKLTKICKSVLGASITLVLLSGCGMREPRVVYQDKIIQVPAEAPPGTVEYAWEEPMVDTVDVPPGLDPEGQYYRPAHKEVIEVRQGRWTHYTQPRAQYK
ncbi:MAG: hypothetical protein H6619_06805 [Deltaproteobacteria bacterium]|nr:hypothetical protein [Deltaproteobacteria bacterium]